MREGGGGEAAWDVRRYGARGDGAAAATDTAAIAAAVRDCAAAGGGTVRVPAGDYRVGPFDLLSNVTLHLEAGATLRASERLEDYPREAAGGSMESQRAGLITARGASNVAIVGRGTVCGTAPAFVEAGRPHLGNDLDRRHVRQGERYLTPETALDGPWAHGGDRPGNLIRFLDCEKVRIEGVTICDSPTWTVHFARCRDVAVTGAHIHSHGSGRMVPNDDGIDVKDCEGVRIHGCLIETGDDCVAVFGGSDILVTGCSLASRSCAVRVGYAGPGDVRQCLFSDLIIREAHRGLGVFVRGGGSVEDVAFHNILMSTRLYAGHWWGKGEPIHVSAVPLRDAAAGGGAAAAAATLGRIRNVRFSEIMADAEGGVVLWGAEESPLEDVSLERVRVRLRGGPHQAAFGGNFDLRGAADPAAALFAHDIPALYARHVRGLTVRGADLGWGGGDLPGFFGPRTLECERFQDLALQDVRLAALPGAGAAEPLALREGVGALLSGVRQAGGGPAGSPIRYAVEGVAGFEVRP